MKEYKNNRNPVLPVDVHIPDGEPHVMPDGKLYIYGSYDTEEDNYCSGEYHVASTPDGLHWTVHDTSFSYEDVPWLKDPDAPKYSGGVDWTNPTPVMKKMIRDMMKDKTPEELMEMQKKQEAAAAAASSPSALYAPDCICRDGKYYLYYCTEDNQEGVAVSDRPEGPFTDAGQLPCGGIDPAVFIDKDGKAYYYWDQFRSKGVLLNDDMVSFDPDRIVEDLVTEEEHFFHEGSSMRRIGDTYYYVYADVERGKPTSLGYATSDSPLGPFTYRGIIIDNADCDPESWNNHGSIECFQGQWYVCYHRSTRNSRTRRRLCMEKITILEDGTIPEVKMTSQGIGEPFAPGEKIMGYQVCGIHGGAYIDVDAQCGEKLTNIREGDELIFRYAQGEPAYGRAVMETRGKGSLEIFLDAQKVGTLEISGDGETLCSETILSMEGLPPKKDGYEVTLRCTQGEGLELLSVTLDR